MTKSSSAQPLWRVPTETRVLRRRWGDEVVLFEPRSGQTHLVTDLADKALTLLSEQPRTEVQLINALANTGAGDGDTVSVFTQIRDLLPRLEALGLAETCQASE